MRYKNISNGKQEIKQICLGVGNEFAFSDNVVFFEAPTLDGLQIEQQYIADDQIDKEVARYLIARKKLLDELKQQASDHPEDKDLKSYLEICSMVIKDKRFDEAEIRKAVSSKNVNAEIIVKDLFIGVRDMFEMISDPYIQERFGDIESFARRMFRHLGVKELDKILSDFFIKEVVPHDLFVNIEEDFGLEHGLIYNALSDSGCIEENALTLKITPKTKISDLGFDWDIIPKDSARPILNLLKQLIKQHIVISINTPSEVIDFYATGRIKGIVSATNSKTEHQIMFAPDHGIAVIVNADLSKIVEESGFCFLDSMNGILVSGISAAKKSRYLRKIQLMEAEKQQTRGKLKLPSRSYDGRRYQLLCNIGSLDDLKHENAKYIEGSGLVRFEKVFSGFKVAPSRAKQMDMIEQIYSLFEYAAIRLPDTAADKKIEFLKGNKRGLGLIRSNPDNEKVYFDNLSAALATTQRIKKVAENTFLTIEQDEGREAGLILRALKTKGQIKASDFGFLNIKQVELLFDYLRDHKFINEENTVTDNYDKKRDLLYQWIDSNFSKKISIRIKETIRNYQSLVSAMNVTTQKFDDLATEGLENVISNVKWQDIGLANSNLEEIVRKLINTRNRVVSLTIPMVEKEVDIQYINTMLQSAALNLEQEFIRVNVKDVELGAMIETAEAVENLKAILNSVSHISIGTNDLSYYLFHEKRFDSDKDGSFSVEGAESNPLKFIVIDHIIKLAHSQQVLVSVCGDAAKESEWSYFFTALNAAISVPLGQAPNVKLNLNAQSLSKIEQIKEEILELIEVRKLIKHVLNVDSYDLDNSETISKIIKYLKVLKRKSISEKEIYIKLAQAASDAVLDKIISKISS